MKKLVLVLLLVLVLAPILLLCAEGHSRITIVSIEAKPERSGQSIIIIRANLLREKAVPVALIAAMSDASGKLLPHTQLVISGKPAKSLNQLQELALGTTLYVIIKQWHGVNKRSPFAFKERGVEYYADLVGLGRPSLQNRIAFYDHLVTYKVASTPAGAAVYLAGEYFGKTPIEFMPEKSSGLLEIKKELFETYHVEVTPDKDKKIQEYDIRLNKINMTPRTIQLHAGPSRGAQVVTNDSAAGMVPCEVTVINGTTFNFLLVKGVVTNSYAVPIDKTIKKLDIKFDIEPRWFSLRTIPNGAEVQVRKGTNDYYRKIGRTPLEYTNYSDTLWISFDHPDYKLLEKKIHSIAFSRREIEEELEYVRLPYYIDENSKRLGQGFLGWQLGAVGGETIGTVADDSNIIYRYGAGGVFMGVQHTFGKRIISFRNTLMLGRNLEKTGKPWSTLYLNTAFGAGLCTPGRLKLFIFPALKFQLGLWNNGFNDVSLNAVFEAGLMHIVRYRFAYFCSFSVDLPLLAKVYWNPPKPRIPTGLLLNVGIIFNDGDI